MIEDLFGEAEGKVDEVEVLIGEGQEIRADMRRGEITIGSASRSAGIMIRTIKDGRIGISSSDSPERWKECLYAAIAGGNLADKQNWGGLPGDASTLTSNTHLAFDPELSVSSDCLKTLISGLVTGSKEHDAAITSAHASLSSGIVTLANSGGLFLTEPTTHVSASIEMIQGQSTGYEYDASWELQRVEPIAVGKTASWYASAGERGIELDTGTYDIVLSPDALSQLLDAVLVPALSGRNVHAGRSVLADRVGDQVCGEQIQLYDDPLDPRGSANCYWDGEGVPVRRIDLIRDGILQRFAYDLRTAYRYGKETTASAVRTGMAGSPGIGFHNLILNGPPGSVYKEDAVFIRDVVGAHTANPMSGDFSVELSSPFLIRDGKLAQPIRSAMLSGNVFSLLNQVLCVSKETRTRGNMILPTVLIADQTLIGKA